MAKNNKSIPVSIEPLPESVEEVRTRMNEFGISEEYFSAEMFYYHYYARNWMMRGEIIERWSSLLFCWKRNSKKNRLETAKQKKTKNETSSSTASSTVAAEKKQAAAKTRSEKVDEWLDCQYPMPEEPEKRQAAERLEHVYSLEHQPQFGKYEHLKEILTSNNITLEAAVKTISPAITERIIIRHLNELSAHFHTPLLTYSLLEMQQTARLIINKAPRLKFSELMLICQRAKEENLLPQSRVCRGDIMELIHNYPEWKRNTLEYL